MPLRRPALYTRSLSKAAKSPSSPTISPPPTPLNSPSSSEVTSPFVPTPLAHLRRSKKATELPGKSSKAKKVYSWSNKLSPRTGLDMAFDDDKAFHCDEAPEQDWDDTSLALGRGNKLPESDVRPQVQLADLLVTTKKARRKGKDGDFEVIPPVRSVIALDDTATPDLDIDEPWEHIYGVEDDSTIYEPSYAKIASLN